MPEGMNYSENNSGLDKTKPGKKSRGCKASPSRFSSKKPPINPTNNPGINIGAG
jgi:hypothetical protein